MPGHELHQLHHQVWRTSLPRQTWAHSARRLFHVFPSQERRLNPLLCSCSETEARFLQKKVSSDAFRPLPLENVADQQAPHSPTSINTECFKRRRTSSSQSDEPGAKVRRETEICYVTCDGSPAPSGESLALFTPPYSPASSSSTLQQEELSHDILMDVHGYTDQLLSSPECSPSYYSYPEAELTCHHSPSSSLASAAEQTFDRAAFGARSPAFSSSPNYDFQVCTADARLVPDCPSMSDMCKSPVDCALHHDDFSLLEQPQGGDLVQVHHVPYHAVPTHSILLTPSQSPTSTETLPYNEREQAEISILAQQISSLASSFAMYHTHSPLQSVNPPSTTNTTVTSACDWPRHAPLPSALPLKRQLVLDDGVFDSILRGARKSGTSCSDAAASGYQHGLLHCRNRSLQSEPEPLGISPTITEEPLPAEQFTAMDPFSLQLGCHEQNTGLHQLNHYMQSGLQQGSFNNNNSQWVSFGKFPKGYISLMLFCLLSDELAEENLYWNKSVTYCTTTRMTYCQGNLQRHFEDVFAECSLKRLISESWKATKVDYLLFKATYLSSCINTAVDCFASVLYFIKKVLSTETFLTSLKYWNGGIFVFQCWVTTFYYWALYQCHCHTDFIMEKAFWFQRNMTLYFKATLISFKSYIIPYNEEPFVNVWF